MCRKHLPRFGAEVLGTALAAKRMGVELMDRMTGERAGNERTNLKNAEKAFRIARQTRRARANYSPNRREALEPRKTEGKMQQQRECCARFEDHGAPA